MDFSKINKVAGMVNFLPTKKIIELEPLTYYKTIGFRTMKTKYGSKLLVTINGSFVIFLPARVSKHLSENPDELEMHKPAATNDELFIRLLAGPCNRYEFTSNTNNL